MVNLIDNNFSTILGRKRLKISTVAKETGISRTTLTNLYYGRSKQVTLDVMNKLCSCLNCDVGELFEFKREEATR